MILTHFLCFIQYTNAPDDPISIGCWQRKKKNNTYTNEITKVPVVQNLAIMELLMNTLIIYQTERMSDQDLQCSKSQCFFFLYLSSN